MVTAMSKSVVWWCGVLALGLAGCGGGGGGGGGAELPDPGNPNLLLNLPEPGLQPAQLALLVAEGDTLSEAVAAAYLQARKLPAANLIRVRGLDTSQPEISAAAFAALRADIEARLPAGIQASLLTWAAPTRVRGNCRMGITSAMAFGYDDAYCMPVPANCLSTRASPYFDSESLRPHTDHGLRPAMLLGAGNLTLAQALIARSLAAEASHPPGTGYFVRTSDAFRNGRANEFEELPAQWAGALTLNFLDKPSGDVISGRSDLLFYLTGLASVGGLDTLSFRPGALADHLTSFGGHLPSGNGQMPVTRWLEAGATASYGTVEEPCGIIQKFPRAPQLVDHYWRGATALEAYWKSVQQPGQGLFVGDPLARPFASKPTLSIEAGQYRLRTRALRPSARYTLEYRNGAGSWVELGSVTGQRATAVDQRFPLAPSSASKIRWRGPCPGQPAAACTLAESP